MKNFLEQIDFKALKKQKQTLLKVIDKSTKKENDDLTGILNLIDALQDEAVDKYGYKESKVFKLSRKDK